MVSNIGKWISKYYGLTQNAKLKMLNMSLIWSSHAPQKSPGIDTERTHSSNFFMSVSSSQGLTSSRTDDLPPAQPKAICQYSVHSFETAEVSLQIPELPHKLCPRRRCTVSLQRLHRLLHKTVQKEVQSYCKDSTDILTKLCPEGGIESHCKVSIDFLTNCVQKVLQSTWRRERQFFCFLLCHPLIQKAMWALNAHLSSTKNSQHNTVHNEPRIKISKVKKKTYSPSSWPLLPFWMLHALQLLLLLPLSLLQIDQDHHHLPAHQSHLEK